MVPYEDQIALPALCEVLGVSRFVLMRLIQQDGLPYLEKRGQGRGSEYLFSKTAVMRWAFERSQKAGKATDEQGNVLDLNAERARLAKWQADQTELKVKALNGELGSVKAFEQALTDCFARCNSRLSAMPVKAAPRLVDRPSAAEIQGLLAGFVREAQAELVEGPIIAAAVDNGRAEFGGSPEEGAPGVQPPAGADREPVGRRAPPAKPRGQRRARAVVD
jgi:phage terminase Nu1 subunit (DNA packaging protein)